MENEVYEKWLEYYDNNGLSWLATQVQASIKQAFFAGYEAAQQIDALDGELPCPTCKGEVGHRINCPHGIAFSSPPVI